MWVYNSIQVNYYYYNYNDFLMIIMSLKWAYIASLVIFQTEFGSDRSNRVCNMFGAKADTLFIIKCLLKQNPLRYLIGSFIGAIAVFGWIIMIAESPLDRSYSGPGTMKHTYSNSCWEVLCTMSTVGYGDIYPRTTIGRTAALFCSLVGVILVSLLVVTFNSILSLDNQECAAFVV